jgi:hypothetical protein
VRYIVGDERSGSEIATVLGKAISKDLSWVVFTDEQQADGLTQAGLPTPIVNGYVQMGKAMREGAMLRDARRSKPNFTPTRLEEFAKEFASAFNS